MPREREMQAVEDVFASDTSLTITFSDSAGSFGVSLDHQTALYLAASITEIIASTMEDK